MSPFPFGRLSLDTDPQDLKTTRHTLPHYYGSGVGCHGRGRWTLRRRVPILPDSTDKTGRGVTHLVYVSLPTTTTSRKVPDVWIKEKRYPVLDGKKVCGPRLEKVRTCLYSLTLLFHLNELDGDLSYWFSMETIKVPSGTTRGGGSFFGCTFWRCRLASHSNSQQWVTFW